MNEYDNDICYLTSVCVLVGLRLIRYILYIIYAICQNNLLLDRSSLTEIDIIPIDEYDENNIYFVS